MGGFWIEAVDSTWAKRLVTSRLLKHPASTGSKLQRPMALPSFGHGDEPIEPDAPAEPLSPLLEAADDELLPGPEDDVETQLECFLETLPLAEANEAEIATVLQHVYRLSGSK